MSVEKDALREAAAWVAEGIGYPVQAALPDRPMPPALWDALVDHVHADESGTWHGNELDREDVESWLADEAGRTLHDCATCSGCLHDGHKCCGCYDGACCITPPTNGGVA